MPVADMSNGQILMLMLMYFTGAKKETSCSVPNSEDNRRQI